MKPSPRLIALAAAVLVLSLVVLPLTRSSTATARTPADVPAVDAPPGGTGGASAAGSTTSALDLLGPDLAAVATSGSEEVVLVDLLTRDDPDIGRLVESWRATTVRLGGMRSVAALVRADRLVKVALHPDVVAVLPAAELLAPGSPVAESVVGPGGPPGDMPPSVDGAGAPEDASVDLWYARQMFGVDRAAANGFDGTGVIVGLEASGVDFGHPDLQGTFARVQDPTGG